MKKSEVKMKAGLEIHQQLDTGKLFCRCPGFLRKDEPEFSIKRKLHAVPGETGEVDIAVEYEAALGREFIYEGYYDNCCLVELDEEPPREINDEALDEAIKISLLMNCEIYPVSQIMRKTVIDGSNTAGFQRTVLIAHDGFIETSFGQVAIESVTLEEDAARIISKDKSNVVYRLDRLGIPLIEIATAPVLHSSDEVKEAALKIGEVLRACKVKRGIGTIRQDVNVSITGHEKVEIKGFQEPTMFVKTIQLEVERQKKDILQGKIKGDVRNALPDGKTEFLRPLPGRARMYPETDLPLIKISRERINSIKQMLPRLKSEIRDELKKKGLTDELINLVLDGNLDEFETLMKVYDNYENQDSQRLALRGKATPDANLVAKIITLWRNELGKKKKISIEKVKEILSEAILEKILENVREKKIEKNHVKEIMEKILSGISFEDAIKIEKISDDETAEEIGKIIKEKPGLSPNAYMGLVMQKLKGKVNAKRAMDIIKRALEK